MKDVKKVYPVLVGGTGVGLILGLGLLLSRLDIAVQVEPIVPDQPTPLPPQPSLSLEPLPSPTPTPSPDVDPSPLPSVAAAQSSPADPNTVHQGSLRVSNQTTHPIRVVLLSTASKPSSSTPTPTAIAPNPDATYDEPVHWDFAPQEGSVRGLLLSLPNGELRLQEGDVLIAFAQDGSQRYWGPYVVGKTMVPTWNARETEWQLVLRIAN